MREELVNGIIDYFKGPHWTDFMENHLVREYGEEVYHVHIYVDTMLHPESLSQLIDLYFKSINRPLTRSMDPQQQREGVASIHGIHSLGCPHWEMIFRFNKDTVLGPMPTDCKEAEHGRNLLSWDRTEINEFQRKFPFKAVGPREDAEIQEYFLSKHWKDTLTIIMDPTVTHVHPNVEINFDPKVLELYMRQAFAKIGWTVEKTIPCIFDMKTCVRDKHLAENDPRNAYVGKIGFLLGHPEKQFDVAWLFNPDVTIRPAQEPCISDTPGFDVWRMKNYDAFLDANPYAKLTQDEIAAVAAWFNRNKKYVRKTH